MPIPLPPQTRVDPHSAPYCDVAKVGAEGVSKSAAALPDAWAACCFIIDKFLPVFCLLGRSGVTSSEASSSLVKLDHWLLIELVSLLFLPGICALGDPMRDSLAELSSDKVPRIPLMVS